MAKRRRLTNRRSVGVLSPLPLGAQQLRPGGSALNSELTPGQPPAVGPQQVVNTDAIDKARAWKPFSAPDEPPPGTFDPAFDAASRASARGLGDFQRDTERDDTRALVDYNLGSGNIQHARQQTLGDIFRQYRSQGVAQTSGAAAAGVLDGSTLAASRLKRSENSTRDRTRTNYEADRQLGELSRGYTRGVSDRATALDRATRENKFFGQDVLNSELFQARQTGWIPPQKPKNEKTLLGHHVRIRPHGMVLLPNGTLLSREEARKRWGRPNRRSVGFATANPAIGGAQ